MFLCVKINVIETEFKRKMKRKISKKLIGRELKELIPSDTRKMIRQAVGGYGNTIKLSNVSGVNRVTIKNAVKHGKATPKVLADLLKGIKVLEKQKQAV